MVHTCFLCKWRSDKEPKRSFHTFPSNKERRKNWLDSIGHSNAVLGKGAVLCSRHFDNTCFRYGLVRGREFLKDGSLPSLNLTNNNDSSMNIANKNEGGRSQSSLEIQLVGDTTVNTMSTENCVHNTSITPPSKDSLMNRPSCKRSGTSFDIDSPGKKICWTNISIKDFTESPVDGGILLEKMKGRIASRNKKILSLKREVRRLRHKVVNMKSIVKVLLQ